MKQVSRVLPQPFPVMALPSTTIVPEVLLPSPVGVSRRICPEPVYWGGLSGSPSRFAAVITLRAGFGVASSILFMKTS